MSIMEVLVIFVVEVEATFFNTKFAGGLNFRGALFKTKIVCFLDRVIF